MNRQAPGATRSTPITSGYRPAQSVNAAPAPAPTPNASMYYATAGAQTTSQQPQQASSRGPGAGGLPAGYPSTGAPAPRGAGAPPGFASRATGGDQGDFPALGTHATSSYASQAQQYLSQQPPLTSGLQPPGPPPGISAPGAGSGGSGAQSHTNGSRDEGDDFPALGGGLRGPGSVVSDGKDRLSGYMRNPSQHTQAPPSPPSTLPNGTGAGASGSHSHSNSATPSVNAGQHQLPHMGGLSISGGGGTTADSSWLRETRTPSRGIEQISRPAQQILTSPVDQWGLQALLYEIKMGKPMVFGEDLADLGIDMNSEEPLYPTFVTPWLDPSQRTHPVAIEEDFRIPDCYKVTAPPMSSKLGNFAEDTLFYIFYTQPQDVAQLESAEELYNRGWRYHIPSSTWMSSPLLAGFDPRDNPPTADMPAFQGPFVIFEQQSFKRIGPQTLQINPTDFEATRTAHSYIAEENARKESLKSPNGSTTLSVR